MEPRLLSRFKWGLSADMQAPDIETRIRILKRKAFNDGIELPEDVIDYVASRVKSNVREMEGLFISLIAQSSLNKKAITLDLARQLVEQRKQKIKDEEFSQAQKVTLDNLFNQLSEGELKELKLIVKADVQGSVEAVKQSLEKLSNDEVRVKVIHGAAGGIIESDVALAAASNAIIVGFNVRPDTTARDTAEREGVDIRLYRIIYDAIEEIQSAMKGMLAPKFRENQMATIEVRTVYKISNVGTVAGCYVQSGKVVRNSKVRLVRDGIVICDDDIDSLRRGKDDVKEVAQGYECGIGLEKFADIKEGDIFEEKGISFVRMVKEL